MDSSSAAAAGSEPIRPGRKRDPLRDVALLDATLDVLAEHGYERMTMETVAARAGAGKATVYRRWPSKAHLVLDAVNRVGTQGVDLADLPDTGSLRDDLTELITPDALDDGRRLLKILSAVAAVTAAKDNPELAAAATASFTGPWIAANRVLLERAVTRGEISSTSDLELMSCVIPGMCFFRIGVQGEPLDRAYVVALIDRVLLPAVMAGARYPELP